MKKLHTEGILCLLVAAVGIFFGSPFSCTGGSQLSSAHQTEEPELPPLHIAARKGNRSQVRVLCHTEDLARQDHKGRQALHFAVAAPRPSLPCAIELIRAGADMYAEDMNKQSPFLYAIAAGSYPMCLFFLQERKAAGIPVLSAAEKSLALAIAAYHGHSDIIKLLLSQANAPMNIQALELGGTPLQWSIFGRHLSTTDYLLRQGANVNTESCHKQRTALHHAAAWGSPDVIALLLAYGANTDLQDCNGNTPLDEAVRCKNYPVIEFLRRIEQRGTWPLGSDTQLSPLRPSIAK